MATRGAPLFLFFSAILGCSNAPPPNGSEEPGPDAGMADADPGTLRAACAFSAGARVEETLGLGDGARGKIPIRNVVILMKENRSYDHVLGQLHDRGQPDSEAIPPWFANADLHDVLVRPYHET